MRGIEETMRRTILVVAIVLGVSLVGCGQSQPEAASKKERPSPSAAASASANAPLSPTPVSEAPPVETPLEGTWRLKQTKQDVVRHLRQAGFGDLVERFIRVEGVTPEDHWEWSFTGDDFVANWQNPDGSWKVADYGTFEVSGDRASFLFTAAAGETNATTFKWRMDGDRLWLDWVDYRGAEYKGLPDEAFWRAYLTKPLARVS
jgi:hypothetical protein